MKPETLKALAVLGLGSVAVYLVLKAREAKAAVEKPVEPPTPPFVMPEIKVPEVPAYSFDFEKGTATFNVNGTITTNISWATDALDWLFGKLPFTRNISMKTYPYKQGAPVFETK